jgi:hypothetical protein
MIPEIIEKWRRLKVARFAPLSSEVAAIRA